ncbi:hypothetical protein FVE85_7183 [Porphyridium purpureum]|uniref:Neutral/alkaline non-lysosomal ceramidase N-terminal domain-containing protein n=1 Tax=Porphyridium purpureum TaxID=35688 RepID=A0A5J4Z8W8_PORPP|nr:hypothetical protein FVE85_7183 [Porphyridium purpureum]|eukprot:POR8213..scf295_1
MPAESRRRASATASTFSQRDHDRDDLRLRAASVASGASNAAVASATAPRSLGRILLVLYGPTIIFLVAGACLYVFAFMRARQLSTSGRAQTSGDELQSHFLLVHGVRDITPQAPLWLAGFASRTRPAESAQALLNIPLWCKAIALQANGMNMVGESLEDSERPHVLISLDLIGGHQSFRRKVAKRLESSELGLRPGEWVLSFSHTHSGPVFGDVLQILHGNLSLEHKQQLAEYENSVLLSVTELVSEVLKGLLDAKTSAQPVLLRYIPDVTFSAAVDRRANRESELRMGYPRRGVFDHSVPVLSFESMRTGRPVVVVYSYAAHATVLTENFLYSGDFPAFASLAIEKVLRHEGENALAVFVPGCAGDQNMFPRGRIEDVQALGFGLADEILAGIFDKTKVQSVIQPLLRSRFNELEISFERRISIAELRLMARSTAWYEQALSKMYLRKLKQLNMAETDNVYPYPLALWAFGRGNASLSVAWLSGEAVVDFSELLRECAGSRLLVVSAYAFEVMGYIPSKRVWLEGGYESGQRSSALYGMPSRFASSLQDSICNAIYRMQFDLSTGAGKDQPVPAV